LPGVGLGAADRPYDRIVGDQWIEGLQAEPDQPQARSRRPLLGGKASAEGVAGQELLGPAHPLDEDDAIVPVASPGMPLQ
jgi:hypothetical protein